MSRGGFSPKPRVFLSYARKDGEKFAARLRKRLQDEEPEITLWQDRAEMEGGVGWWKQIEEALDHVKFLVIVMTPAAMQSEMMQKEWRYARQRGVNVYPVKGCRDDELGYASLPNWMRKAHFFDLDQEWKTFVNYLKSDRQPARVPFMAPDIPEGFVPRPKEFGQLITQLVEPQRESPVAITTALRGAGGYGKTTLAIALCHDGRLTEAFDDGILWVTLGQNPNVLGELNKLYEALTGQQPDSIDEGQAALKLREKLETRNCLLVIDDVWQRPHLESFLQGGKKTCARLITTRRSDLVMDAKRIRVDEMTSEESVTLLAEPLALEARRRNALPLRDLAARLMGWPLLLKLAAGVIRARLARHDTSEGALDYANRLYDRHRLTAFDRKDAVKLNDAAAKSIEASLELLDENERTRLRELAIFPEDTEVPVCMIGLLWGLDDLDTQQILEHLSDYALLDLDLRGGLVRLHDEIRVYLGRTVVDAASLHAKLVDGLGNPKEIQDSYTLRWFVWHLGKAGRDAELRALLLDFEWMTAKLEKTDIQSLLADYDFLVGEEELRLIQSAIRLSAHILARDARQLAGQLIGRLLGNRAPDIQALLKQAAERKTWPWLRPLTPTLTPPGGPLIRTLEGHTESVNAVAVTRDGRRAISASDDRTLRLWDLESGQTVRTLEGHTESVHAVSITWDGRCAISASSDRTLRVWELESGQTVRTLEGHTARVGAIAVTIDGRRAISASYDRTLRLWDLESGQTVRTLEGHTGWVAAVAVTRDGRRAISASHDGTLRVWDLESGQSLRSLKGHTAWVHAVAVTSDERRAISASDDRTLRVWDLESGKTIHTLEGHTEWVCAVAVTSDGRRAISASGDRTLRLWDLESGQTVTSLSGHAARIGAVAVTQDGRRAISASDDRTLRLWDLESGQRMRTLEGHTDRVGAIAVTRDGRRAISASDDRTLRLWDLENGQTVRTLEGHTEWVHAVAITWDGRRAISASSDRTLRLWDLESGQTVHTLGGHTSWVAAVAVTRDGRRAISASGDRTLRVWDLESGQSVRTLEGHSNSVSGVAITPDGRRAISAFSANALRVWDLEGGQTVYTLEGHTARVGAIAVTSDGRRAISASDAGRLRVWDLDRGEMVCTLEGHTGWVGAVAVTSDGRRAISASRDETLRLWDLESGQTLRTLEGHTAWVRAVAVMSDERHAISASDDRTLRVWDLESGEEITTFTGEGRMTSCAVGLDGRTIVAGDDLGRVHFLWLEGMTS